MAIFEFTFVPSPVGNRNVAANPFESRIFNSGLTKYQQGHAQHSGTHYAVANRAVRAIEARRTHAPAKKTSPTNFIAPSSSSKPHQANLT